MPLPVLIAGGGTVGLAAGLFLAHHGIEVLVVDRQAGPSIHPRATGVGQRTLELFREVGIEDAVNAVAIDMSAGGLGKISGATLASADLPGLAKATPTHAQLVADLTGGVSIGMLRGTCPQNRLDSVLLHAARERGATVCYSTELVSFEQDDEGVTGFLDGAQGRRLIQARYLIAADGARSRVRADLGITTSGPGVLGDPLINIFFRADLSKETAGHSFALCDITNPESPGIFVMVDGEKEWIFHTQYDVGAGQSAEDFTPERCREIVRTAVGRADLDVDILSVLPWRLRGLLADRFQDRRVFLVGDAAHSFPPTGAFGMNTGIADAHNLAWKLAYVLHGDAGPALLDSFQAERRPVAALALEQSMLRLADPRLHWDHSPQMVAQRARVGAVNAPIVHVGYRYDSAAIVDPEPELPSREEVALNLDGTPGSRVPHVWVERHGNRISTLDLVESRFTVLSGPGGAGWVEAAAEVSRHLGISLGAYQIGQQTQIADLESRWPGVAGLADDGTLLVRPDGFVAWRVPTMTASPAFDLEQTLSRLLALTPERKRDEGRER